DRPSSRSGERGLAASSWREERQPVPQGPCFLLLLRARNVRAGDLVPHRVVAPASRCVAQRGMKLLPKREEIAEIIARGRTLDHLTYLGIADALLKRLQS